MIDDRTLATRRPFVPLSRRKQWFESPRERQKNQILLIGIRRAWPAVPNICPIIVGGRRQMTMELDGGGWPLC